jgi:hypothetical protein
MSTATQPPIIAPTGKDPAIELKSAAQLYWLYAFFLAVPLGIVVATLEQKPDSLGITLMAGVGVYLALLTLAGFLLFKKKKAGLYFGWSVLPLILLSIPIGTAMGIFIISKITKPDVKALLA